MARETADLMPRAGAEEILRAGRRRARRRTLAAGAAAVALVATAVPVAVWSAGGGERGDVTVGVSPPPASPPTAPPGRTVDPSQVGCPADPKAARPVGDTIWTGTTDSQGKEIVVRFLLQSDRTAIGFGVGVGDSATGAVERLGCSFGFRLPPVAEDYPGLSTEFDGPDFSGPDKTTTIVGSFVGPADRITASYDGEPLTVGFRRWSAFPQLVVYWIAGVPAGDEVNPRDDSHPFVTIFNAAGDVIGPPR
jgi:hypothetical protein